MNEKDKEVWRVLGENPSLRARGVEGKKKEFPSNSNTKCNWPQWGSKESLLSPSRTKSREQKCRAPLEKASRLGDFVLCAFQRQGRVSVNPSVL